LASHRPTVARLLYNPSSAGGRWAGRLERLAREHGLEVCPSRSAEELTEQALLAAERGHERLLVAGGDGTVHHAIRGLAGTDCALAILPTGTGNDLARALGLERDLARAVSRALSGRPRRIDLGRIDGRPYAGVAGLGLDGEVNRFLARRASGPRRAWLYAYATLRTLLSFEPPGVRLEAHGQRYEGPVLLVALANSPLFGGGMRIAPRARMDDGWLDLVIIEPISLARLVVLFPRVYRGTHVDHPAVHSRRVRRATLSCSSDLTLYADGEPVIPVRSSETTIEIWPGALRVI
jgi:diacylglycerol kinase (ATP)